MKSRTARQISQLRRGRRDVRKIGHIAHGMIGFSYAFLEWEILLFIWLLSIFCVWFLPSRVESLEVLLDQDEIRLGYSPAMIHYGLVMAIAVALFYNTPVDSLIVLAAVAFGDGFASLIGMNYPGTPLFYNRDKTFSGFFAFIIFGTIGALALILFFGVFTIHINFIPGLGSLPIFRVLIIMTICAIVETIPMKIPDNLPVGITAIILAFLTRGIVH